MPARLAVLGTPRWTWTQMRLLRSSRPVRMVSTGQPTHGPLAPILLKAIAGLSRMVLKRLPVGGPADRRSPVCRAGDPPRVLTFREQDRSDTIVATAPFVSEVDDIQHEVGRGPCVTAARPGRTVMSGSAGGGSARNCPARSPQRGLVAVGHPRRCGRGDDGGYPTSRTCSMSGPPSSASSSRYRR